MRVCAMGLTDDPEDLISLAVEQGIRLTLLKLKELCDFVGPMSVPKIVEKAQQVLLAGSLEAQRPGQRVRVPKCGWSQPKSASYWSKVFGLDRKTMTCWLNDGNVYCEQVRSKWRIALDELPRAEDHDLRP